MKGLGRYSHLDFAWAFAGVLLLKLSTLIDLPMWDTAMGLFPAALTLNANGFNVMELLQAPGYGAGGSNTHATSLVTLITAAVLRLGGGYAIPVLHLIHVGITALGLTLLYRLALPILGRRNSLGLAAATLLTPLFFVQAGRLYLEMPLFLCAVGMLHAHLQGSYARSVIWATAGFAVKENGIIMPVTLAALLLLEGGSWVSRARRAALAVLPSVVVLSVPMILAIGSLTSGDQPYYRILPPPSQVLGLLGQHVVRFLFRTPDVVVLLLLFVVSVPGQARRLISGLRAGRADGRGKGDSTAAERTSAAVAVLILAFLGLYYVALPFLLNFTFVLPRYYTVIVPFLILWVALRVHEASGGKLTLACLLCIASLGLLNQRGTFYPSDINTEGPGNDFALTERSMAYRALNRVQAAAVTHLTELPGENPVFYGPFEHYALNYPGLGYAEKPLPNGRLMHTDHQWKSVVQSSDCVYAVYNHPWLGGERIRTLAEEVAPALGMAHDTAAIFREGRYVVTIHRFQRNAGACQD